MRPSAALNKLEIELTKARQTYFIAKNVIVYTSGDQSIPENRKLLKDRELRLSMILDATGWERNDDND